MDYAVIISAIVLGLSVLATGAKFIDWFLHSDPKTMVRTIRWMLLLLVIAAIPLLVMLIAREQYAAAMLLGAAMIVVPTFLKWRAILVPLRAAFALFRTKPPPFEMPPVWQEPAAPDPRAVQHAAALLEAYLKHATSPASPQRQISFAPDDQDDAGMAVKEALDVLGLAEGADLASVHVAHRRLMRGADPDTGGSPYLAARIDEARDVLVAALRRQARPATIESPGRPRLLKG